MKEEPGWYFDGKYAGRRMYYILSDEELEIKEKEERLLPWWIVGTLALSFSLALIISWVMQ